MHSLRPYPLASFSSISAPLSGIWHPLLLSFFWSVICLILNCKCMEEGSSVNSQNHRGQQITGTEEVFIKHGCEVHPTATHPSLPFCRTAPPNLSDWMSHGHSLTLFLICVHSSVIIATPKTSKSTQPEPFSSEVHIPVFQYWLQRLYQHVCETPHRPHQSGAELWNSPQKPALPTVFPSLLTTDPSF